MLNVTASILVVLPELAQQVRDANEPANACAVFPLSDKRSVKDVSQALDLHPSDVHQHPEITVLKSLSYNRLRLCVGVAVRGGNAVPASDIASGLRRIPQHPYGAEG
jgi:hypothetical protein